MGSRRLWVAISALLSIGLAGLFVASSDTFASFAQGKITNSSDTNGAGSLGVTHSYSDSKPPFSGTITCTQALANVTAKTCTSGIQPATGTTASGSTSTDSITNNGTLPSSRLSTQLSGPASPHCLPVQFANSKTTTSPLLARNQILFQQSDKWGTTSAATFSGTGYASSPVSTTLGGLSSAFSIGVWFKTPTNGYSQGGALISLSTSPSNATSSSGAGPMLWMDNTGKIRAQVLGTAGAISAAGVSAAAYNDGNWHFAMLTVGTLTANLYVDSATAVSTVLLSLLSGSTAVYWHAGWGDFTGTTAGTVPTSSYFNGSLSGGFLVTAVLSSANRTTLFGESSAANYKSGVLGISLSILNLWMFDDSGTTTYSGTMPATMANPCSMLTWSVAFANPSGSLGGTWLLEATTQTGSSDLWNTLFTWEPMGPAPGGGPETLTMTLSRVGASPPTGGTTYNTDISGLHLYLPITYTINSYPRTGVTPWSQSYTWNDAYSAFIA